MLKLLYFARLRETLGVAREEYPFTEGMTDVASLVTALKERGGKWQTELNLDKTVRVAVNQDMGSASSLIHDGDEVAFFPPVTGG
jgi:molybdopterin synthase sulfur carrier subunit